MAVYLGSDKVGVTKELGTDRLQWICDNVKSLNSTFRNYSGSDFSILNGLDTSKVRDMQYCFFSCANMTTPPMLNTINVTDMSNMFYDCKKITEMPKYDMSNVSTVYGMFYNCYALQGDIIFDAPNCTNFGSLFYNCGKIHSVTFTDTSKGTNAPNFYYCKLLESVKNLDCVNTSSFSTSMFSGCFALKELEMFNIKKKLSIGSGTSYGTLLTLDSLVHTIQQLWDLTGSTSQKLTMSTASKNLIADVYVKLVEPTAEQIEADPNIIYKKNCVVCESTDEGAMTITEYATSKNWAIA